LQLSLVTDSANVATAGSSISYRGVVVGQVDNITLDKAADKVRINVTIDDEHKSLIRPDTRFYNASGIMVSGGLGDFVVKTESVDSILRGGISFYNPNSEIESTIAVKELARFELFAHFEEAENAGLAISIHFNDFSGLKVNTKVIYQDQKVGTLTRLIFDDNTAGVTAFVLLNDIGTKFAAQGTRFWVVEPEIGLVGSKNLSSILEGSFISLLPGITQNKQQTVFAALDLPPTIKQLSYGLNIKLTAKRLGSVRVGNPLLYRQVKVGEVIGIDLSPTSDTVDIFINIAKRYAPLVNKGSKFWNTSGVNIEAGIFSGVNIDSESIETLIAGGIAFASPALNGEPAFEAEIIDFILHQEVDDDWLEWQPTIAISQ
jgi:paraquat-inducible protein B